MRFRCLNHDCLKLLDSATGWIKEPDGRVYCWECFDAGRVPPIGADAYADVGTDPEPEPAPKPEPKRRHRAVDDMKSSIVEGW